MEHYECENWLSRHLISASPNDHDKELLSSLGYQILRASTLWHTALPSSLARVIFHHLFVGAPASLDSDLTTTRSLGLDVAFHVLRSVIEHKDMSVSSLFHYSVCRLWSKLAEVVLRSVSDSKTLLKEAMSCILKQDGLLGPGAELIDTESEPHANQTVRQVPSVEVKSRVASGLGKAICKKPSHLHVDSPSSLEQTLHHEGMPKKIMKCGSDQALNLCAIQLGAHSLWLQKRNGKNYLHGDVLR